MLLSVRTRNSIVSDSLRQHADRKFQKLEKFFHHVETAEMEVAQERGLYTVELSVLGDGLSLRSEERCNDINAAVDNALDKMDRQIKSLKTRVRKSHQRPGPVKQTTAEKISTLLEGEDSEEENSEEVKELKITRRKRFPMKPMPPEEAALQMELLDHDFFLFMNEHTRTVNLLYRRRDGDYGLIEPEK
jgi:putative sigma-54 modulation protein